MPTSAPKLSISLLAITLLIAGQTAKPFQRQDSAPARRPIPPLTVCEVLSELHQHNGKLVAVLGRLSSQMFDGTWLYMEKCGPAASRGTSPWEFAVFLGCSAGEPPPRTSALFVDPIAVNKKLEILRGSENSGARDHPPQRSTTKLLMKDEIIGGS